VTATGGPSMIDLILIVVTCITFALAFALVRGFERL
jgi:hypothetical protein